MLAPTSRKTRPRGGASNEVEDCERVVELAALPLPPAQQCEGDLVVTGIDEQLVIIEPDEAKDSRGEVVLKQMMQGVAACAWVADSPGDAHPAVAGQG